MFLQLMIVPAKLLAAVAAGDAYVDGAVVKDVVTNQILAHMQPTQRLANQVLNVGLNTVANPVTMVSSLVNNVQLLQVKHMVEALQQVATIGAAASVLNLGVSVGGFALVLRSLNKLDGKVDGVARQVSEMLANQHADFMGKVQHALRRAEEAYGLSSAQERTRYWRETDTVLAEVTESGLLRMASQGLALEGQTAERLSLQDRQQLLARPEILGGLRLLTAASAARSEALLCLGEPGAAIPVLQRVGQWLQPLPQSAKALAQERLRGHALPPSQIKAAALQAKATSILVDAGQRAAEQRAHLCGWLAESGSDTAKYMLELHRDPEARELVWMRPDAQHMVAA